MATFAGDFAIQRQLAKGGPGSRGGHVIGVTRTGRAIYSDAEAHAPIYHGMSPGEHATAARLHSEAAAHTPDQRLANHHEMLAEGHRESWRRLTAPAGAKRPEGARAASA